MLCRNNSGTMISLCGLVNDCATDHRLHRSDFRYGKGRVLEKNGGERPVQFQALPEFRP